MKLILILGILVSIGAIANEPISEFERGLIAGKESCKPSLLVIQSFCLCVPHENTNNLEDLSYVTEYSNGTTKSWHLGTFKSDTYDTFLGSSCTEAMAKFPKMCGKKKADGVSLIH